MLPIGGAGMDVGVGFERYRGLLCHGTCLGFVHAVSDEMPRQLWKRSRRRRCATYAETHARAMSLVVDRDLRGCRSNGEIAVTPADLSECGRGPALAPDRPVDFLET